MIKRVGIYHDKDLDGLSCGALMQIRFPKVELIGWDYSYDHSELIQMLEEIEPDEIYMADLSLPDNFMQVIADMCDFKWIDHHKTAIESISLDKLSGYRLNTRYAACELLHDYLFPDNEMPDLIKMFGIYDTWRKDEVGPGWESEIIPLQLYWNAHFSVDEIAGALLSPRSYEKSLEKGRAYMEHEQIQFAHAYRTGWMDLSYTPERMFVTNSSVNPGRFRDYCQQQDSSIDIVCVFYQSGPGKWKYSLRSTITDVSAIAKMHGGGGHKHAAGFTSRVNLFEE